MERFSGSRVHEDDCDPLVTVTRTRDNHRVSLPQRKLKASLRLSCWIVVAFACLSAASALAKDERLQHRALLVGISDYTNHPQLLGPNRDVQLMRSALLGRFDFRPDDIETLTDKAATGKGIRAALQRLAETATEGAVVVVHFSGYGGQLPDDRNEELDGLDETLVPSDATRDGAGELRDDELDELLEPIVRKTQRLTVVLDTCYVGVATRDGVAGRCVARGMQNRALAKASRDFTNASATRSTPRYSTLNAAGPLQIANEAVLGAAPYGVFTYELVNALVNLPGAPSFQAVHDRVFARVRTRFPTQEPAFSMRDPQAAMFYDASMRSEFVGFVNPSDSNAITVSMGQFHGVATGTRLDLFPPDTKRFADIRPIATLEITRLGDIESVGRRAAGRVIPAGSIARRTVVNDSASLSAWFETGETGQRAELAKLRERLRNDPQISVVDSRALAQMHVVVRDDGFAILAGDLTALKGGIESVADLDAALRQMAHWSTLLRLSNPASRLSIEVSLRRPKSDEALRGAVRPGEIIEYGVTNTSAQPLYVQALLMASDGVIGASAPIQIASGKTSMQRLGTFLADDRAGATDYIKVFAAPEPFEVERLTNRSGRGAAFAKGADWTTAQVSYELRRVTTRVNGFAVHTRAQSGSESKFKSAGRRTLCLQTEGCVAGRALDREGTLLVIEGASARSLADDTRPGAAFQHAYDMQQQLGAERVEPLFDVALGGDLQGIEGRSGSAENDPAAAQDQRWSLNYVNAPKAWKVLQRELGRRPGREAQGVRIAHLDTGYREHPELLYKDGDYSTVLTKAGLDLVDGGEPYDTLSMSGAFPNPGHGTASGSVIVSPPDCQLSQGTPPCVTGVALGAQLVPVRVNTSVVVLNQRRLAEAIISVVEGRVGERPRIISIAMGGPPSWLLWRAVKAAEAAGIIVIAAAGNNVGMVVWPARFNSVIAAAAVSVRCRPWSGSSHGPRVDISAPGESVWRAQVDREQYTNVIGMGSGTTFATAITTGAAALWVARHESEEAFKTLAGSGGLTEAFRRSIKETAWRPVADDAHRPQTYCDDHVGWNANEDGAGILDMERMLARPLDVAAARAALRVESSLPLFETLYERGAPLDRVSSDYEQLFPPNKRDGIQQFESEVMFHYAVNDTVRASVDRILAGARAPADYANARRALLFTDLSELLRERLQE